MKNKRFLFSVVIVIVVVIFALLAGIDNKSNKKAFDYKNISYEIDGKEIALVDGYAEEEIAGSDSKTKTNYFGNEAFGDFNGDGLEDVAFLLMQDGGGSGTFFYVVVALKSGETYQGTNGIFLGDRISPQTTEFRDGKIVVNYADRKDGEPMATEPSVGVSRYFEVQDEKLVEVE